MKWKPGKDWFKNGIKKLGRGLLAAVGLFILLDLLLPVKPDITYAQLVEARDGSVFHAYLTRDQQWRMMARLDEITPELRKAIIFKEDKHFYHHPGINLPAVGRAIMSNVFHLKRTSGASTITMQVARMLSPKPRTYINKCIEMFRALQLELHYSKDEILQLYLNLVPYGSNIQGVKAASLLYFGKTPDQLSLAEITSLSIIPNRPNSMVMGRDNARIVKERNKWLSRFKDDKLFSDNIITDALSEPLNASRHAAPSQQPQFAWRMRKLKPGAPEIQTTLDPKMQLRAENIVTNYVNELKLHNINNAAVLVIDNTTHQVVTYIGSSDFNDRFNYGQVDGVRAVRSPGSTLKPLLYGMAFDAGLATPKTVVADVPVNIKGYSPENYDKLFRGNVTVEYSLKNSLNIPAVEFLDQEGVGNFIGRLSSVGFKSITEKRKQLGLSIILGGCGVRLDELTPMYSAFACQGRYTPITYLLPDSSKAVKDTSKNVLLLSPVAAFMVTQTLCELHRPDLPNAFEQARDVPKIAWKTGTSYGRKDAWSIGYNKRYTIGVWLGNFSGAGVPDLSGANTATPLLFRLFNSLDKNAGAEWLQAPKELQFRLVCPETGKVPSDFCHNQVMDYYIPGISRNEPCDHLKETWLSADEHYTYCTSCLPPQGYKTLLLPNITSELASYYESSHIDYKKLPPHNPACTRTFTGQAPIINSLTNGATYLIADKEEQKLQLSCTAATDVAKIYWYINNKFFGATASGDKLFFSPTTPKVKISCTDDKGRTASVVVVVKFI